MNEELDEVEILDEDIDNARDFTSGVVITTTIILIAAFMVVMKALGDFYNVGILADK